MRHGNKNRPGGRRTGAGRKPLIIQHPEKTDALEQRILDALPGVIDKLIAMAKDGDVRAARYLVDRILGRVPIVHAPVVVEDEPEVDVDDEAEWERVRERYMTPERVAATRAEFNRLANVAMERMLAEVGITDIKATREDIYRALRRLREQEAEAVAA